MLMQINMYFSRHLLETKKSIVIFKDTAALFPIHENITSRDQLKIKDTAPAPSGPDPTLKSISKSLKNIAKRGDNKKDLDDMKKLVINITGLPDDVKVIYLQ